VLAENPEKGAALSYVTYSMISGFVLPPREEVWTAEKPTFAVVHSFGPGERLGQKDHLRDAGREWRRSFQCQNGPAAWCADCDADIRTAS